MDSTIPWYGLRMEGERDSDPNTIVIYMPKLKEPPKALKPWLVDVERLILDASISPDEMAFSKSLEAAHLVMSHMGSDLKPTSAAPHDNSAFLSTWSKLLQEWHRAGQGEGINDTVQLVAKAIVLTANKVTTVSYLLILFRHRTSCEI